MINPRSLTRSVAFVGSLHFAFCILISTYCPLISAAEYPPGFVGYDELQGKVYRGNLRRDGVFQASGVPKLTGIKWKFKTGKGIKSSPIMVDGLVYIGSDDKSFYAIDADNGTKKWSFETKSKVYSSAAVVGGKVFFSSGREAYSLNAITGDLNWKKNIAKFNAFGSPAVAYGIVFYVGGARKNSHEETSWGGGRMKGFDVITGKLVWEQSEGIGPQALSSPAILNDELVWTGGYESYKMNLGSGELKWKARRGPWCGATVNTPVIANGFVFDTSCYGADQFGLPLNGEIRVTKFKDGGGYWQMHPYEGTDEKKRVTPKDGKDHSIYTCPTVFGNNIFVADSSGDVHCINYITKKRVWKYQAGGGVHSSICYAKGILYFGCNDGHVYAVDAKSGSLVWKQKCGGKFVSSPYIADGVVYIGGEDGFVYAIH